MAGWYFVVTLGVHLQVLPYAQLQRHESGYDRYIISIKIHTFQFRFDIKMPVTVKFFDTYYAISYFRDGSFFRKQTNL